MTEGIGAGGDKRRGSEKSKARDRRHVTVGAPAQRLNDPDPSHNAEARGGSAGNGRRDMAPTKRRRRARRH